MALTPECRRVVRGLVDVLDGCAEATLAEHVRRCAECSRRVEAARSVGRLLGRVPRPRLPAGADEVLGRALEDAITRSPAAPALRRALTGVPAPDEATLDGVFERVVGSAPLAVTEALRRGLEPTAAPDDAIWREPSPAQERFGRSLPRLLPPRRSPGWMWRRIRGDLEPRRTPPRRTALRVGLLVAGLLATGLLVLHNGVAPASPQGTNPSPEIVWQEVSQPLDPSLSLYAMFRKGR